MLTVQPLYEVGLARDPDELCGSDDCSAVEQCLQMKYCFAVYLRFLQNHSGGFESAAVAIGENYQ